jgi:hypothetical protein
MTPSAVTRTAVRKRRMVVAAPPLRATVRTAYACASRAAEMSGEVGIALLIAFSYGWFTPRCCALAKHRGGPVT